MLYKPSQVWTNLAQIQVIFDERDEALRILLDASQIDPQYWEVWRDLAAVSLACHKLDTFINSYNRLLNLNNEYLNVDLLTNLAYLIVKLKKNGINEVNTNELVQNTQKLFTRVSELKPHHPVLWSLRALVGDTSDILSLMDQALIAANLNSNWHRYHAQVMKTIHETKVIINTMFEIHQLLNKPALSCKLLRKGKGHLKKVLHVLYQYFTDIIRGDIRRDLQGEVKELEIKLANINQMVAMSKSDHKKRHVPKPLQTLLKLDASATTLFCKNVEKIISPVKCRKYYKVLEISCHALPWLALTLASMWILWSETLIQSQINFLLGLIIDIINISLLKAFIRRRRPAGDHSDMFLTVGPDQYSFPSGHVSRAVFVTCFFIHVYPSSFLLHLLLISWALGIIFSRILLRRHHILDVIGGCILGLAEAWLLTVIWISKSTSLWIVSSLSDEATNLEGLQDQDAINDDL